MAGTRKRKHAPAENDTNKSTASQAGIKAFGTVSKAHSDDAGMKKRKTAHKREDTPPAPPKQPAVEQLENKQKRKRGAEFDEEENAAAEASIFKRFAKQNNHATPRNKRFKNVQPPTPADTPSKDTAALFDNLRLGPNTNAIPFALSTARLPDTPPHTPEAEEAQPDFLPHELRDLINLHTAFLSALSLYYAHNGASSAVDVKPLLSMITKNWKKRAVTLDDLRRLLAIEQERPAFILQDSGRAGICLTKSQPRGRTTKRAASFVDETELHAGFEDALHAAWARFTASQKNGNEDATAFIEQLPLVEMAKDDTVEKTAPMFARGHQRLAELKAGQAAAKREPTPVPEAEVQQKPAQATQSRGTNLLDRILAKQAHTASLPAGPTKEQLERKAALHRIEDIARVLDLLAAGRARCSFSMQAMVQQLQQSLRNPISREEVERCLDLMAKEVTPDFVRLVKNGAVTGVVITRGGKVGLHELRRKVAEAGT